MSEKIATVVNDGRVFIALDTLRIGIDILEVVPVERQLEALRQVLDGIEQDSLNVGY